MFLLGILGKNSLPLLSWFLEASCISWLVASSSSKTTAAPDLLVLLHSDSASFILSLPLSLHDFLGRFRRPHQGGVREVPPCPSLVYKVPAPPRPGGQTWSWVALPGVAVSGGHSRTGLGPPISSHSLSAAQWTSHLAFLGLLEGILPPEDLFRHSEYIHSEGSDVFYQVVLQK